MKVRDIENNKYGTSTSNRTCNENDAKPASSAGDGKDWIFHIVLRILSALHLKEITNKLAYISTRIWNRDDEGAVMIWKN